MQRRGFLKCMTWAGTAMVWTVAGGVPRSRLIGSAEAADTDFSFVQISDSHLGFDKPANPNVTATLQQALDDVAKLPQQPAFMIHTGDITHLSKPATFDTAQQLMGATKLTVHTVPGEHDILEEEGKSYLNRFGKGAKGDGWYSFNDGGVHFIGLVNVVNLQGGGLGTLGHDQLEWLEDDVAHLTASTPIVVFAHVPLWTVYADWGWGTSDGAQALSYLKKFGSVTVLNGHIHQTLQKVEGSVAFHTARSTAFPQPAPGSAKSPGPMVVPAGELKQYLGDRQRQAGVLEGAAGDCRYAARRLKEPAMNEMLEPGGNARRLLLRRALGVVVLIGAGARLAVAVAGTRGDRRQFHLRANAADGEGWRHRDLGEPRRHSPQHRLSDAEDEVASDGYRRELRLQVRAGGNLRLHLRPASAYAWSGRGAGIAGLRQARSGLGCHCGRC